MPLDIAPAAHLLHDEGSLLSKGAYHQAPSGICIKVQSNDMALCCQMSSCAVTIAALAQVHQSYKQVCCAPPSQRLTMQIPNLVRPFLSLAESWLALQASRLSLIK